MRNLSRVKRVFPIALITMLTLSLGWPVMPTCNSEVPMTEAASAATNSPAWSDPYRNATLLLSVPATTALGVTLMPICTAFIIAPDNKTGFIITARHCFLDAERLGTRSVRVRFAWEQNRSIDEDGGFELELMTAQGKRLWTEASNGSDLAGIPFTNLRGTKPPGIQISAIGANDFATADDIYDGAPIFIYGFPGFVDKERLTRAITRGGIIAWTDPVDPVNRRFLVDSAIFPGNSGGPVFKVPTGLTRAGNFNVGSRVALLGVAIQTYQASLNAMNPDTRVTGLGSLGVVEPMSQILALVRDIESNPK